MKAVIISIRPKWCELIVSLRKAVEIRKTRPNLDTPFKCYIYMTRAKWAFDLLRKIGLDDLAEWISLAFGKVIGEFTCDRIIKFKVFEDGTVQFWHFADIDKSCLTYEETADYIGKDKTGYSWHISDLKIYDEPKSLDEFAKPCPYDHFCSQFECEHYFPGIWDYEKCEPPCCCFWEKDESIIARAPQSWCYVEEQP